MIAQLSSGHFTAADWLYLIAAILFGLEALAGHVPTWPERVKVRLWCVGLALLAVAFLIT